jgi:exopolysaccharide biosynthesis polyprenyl glycosylphosphotransferase
MIILDRLLKRYSLKKILLMFTDFLVLLCSTYIALSMIYDRGHIILVRPFDNHIKFIQYIFLNVVVIFSFRYFNLYKDQIFQNIFEQFVQIVKSILLAALLLIIFNFFVRDVRIHRQARFDLLAFMSISIVLVFVYRAITLKLITRSRFYRTLLVRRALAVGAGEFGEEFVRTIEQDGMYSLQLVGFLDDDNSKHGQTIGNVPVLGAIDEVDKIVESYNIDEVFITIENISYDQLLRLSDRMKQTGVQVNMVSSHFNVIEQKVGGIISNALDSVPLYAQISSFYVQVIKRIFDLCLGSFLLLLISPIFIVLGISIKLTSKGPIFYKSKVIGKSGKPFYWFKFRSMYVDNDQGLHKKHLKDIITQNKTTEKIKNDPRITSVGRFIRKYSIDELPQLFNVIIGNMSLVGPRPCFDYEYELMSSWQRRRTKVMPGMTGLWQVSGRNKADVSFNDSMILDLYYVSNISFWLDINILLKTVPVVIFGKGGS